MSTEWLAFTSYFGTRTLLAFTHGRGVFRVALALSAPPKIFAGYFEP
ncbi:MAG: hypothetical protein IPK27_15730 [Rhodanobacteraceae bacterium]|nr:hypothetical protein [Rhodanobacteraceae bacterium]